MITQTNETIINPRRLPTEGIFINYDSNERKQGEKVKITLKINNWGFSNINRGFSLSFMFSKNISNGQSETIVNTSVCA